MRTSLLLTLGVLLFASFAATATVSGQTFSAVRVASGLSSPIYVAAPPGDTSRLFIVEKVTGRIKILDLQTQTVNSTPFLTVPGLSTSGERGLLGLAFHPNYATNGLFYVNFTDTSGDTRVVRYQVSANPNVANSASAQAVLFVDQPAANHNGGWIDFGPDGYLYVGMGDGGGSCDNAGEGHNAQNTANLLGDMLRINVNGDDFPTDSGRNYAIPADNPFVGAADPSNQSRDEIWAYGLRNPWRNSFDRDTGDLYIADVGQDLREEIDFQPAASAGGENYGWSAYEGTLTGTCSFPPPLPNPVVGPIHEYAHTNAPADAITGGYVYRGPLNALDGKYFFADFLRNQIWSIEHDGSDVTELIEWTGSDEFTPPVGTIGSIASFGEDEFGNLYIVDMGGELFRLQSKVVGDLNGDGTVDFGDIGPFVTALEDPSAYDALYPFVNEVFAGDVNTSGEFDFGDIVPFVNLINSPLSSDGVAMHADGTLVPEPPTVVLLVIGIAALIGRMWRRRRGSLLFH